MDDSPKLVGPFSFSSGKIPPMKAFLVNLAACALLSAQSWTPLPFPAPNSTSSISLATVSLKHISLMTTKKVLGEGRKAGLWTVAVCNDTNGKLIVPRERIMLAVSITAIPNDLAEDIIGRQVAAAPASFIGANGDKILGLASQGVTAGGIISGSRAATNIGLAMAGVQFFFSVFSKGAPSAQPYFSQLLPDLVPVEPTACSHYYLFTTLMHEPKPIVIRLGQ